MHGFWDDEKKRTIERETKVDVYVFPFFVNKKGRSGLCEKH